MAVDRTFKAFFSYAHHDEAIDPPIVKAFTTELEGRVNGKLMNVRLAIWRDKEGLRTGDRWDPRLETEVGTSDMLIVLLTPRWLESEYCRREYVLFEEVEKKQAIGEYVIPLLARQIENQKKYLKSPQREVLDRLSERQYHKVIATDVLKLSDADRAALVDKIADDIEGMIDRLRQDPQPPDRGPSGLRPRIARELDPRALNFDDNSVVSSEDVILSPRREDGARLVSAQISFHERLFIEGERGRVEFSVRRAYLTIITNDSVPISQVDAFKHRQNAHGARYVIPHGTFSGVRICIDPEEGRSALAELSLPPAEGENRLAHVASVPAETEANQVSAELTVSLSADGLFLQDDRKDRMTPSMRRKIEAILNVAAAKDPGAAASHRLTRRIKVEDRGGQ